MAYDGEILNACGIIEIDFSETWIVAVSGDGPNVCGHLLIYAAGGGGYYFHAVGDPEGKGLNRLVGYPFYMDGKGYKRYLTENGKRELMRRKVALPNPNGALIYVEGLLAEKWTWKVLPHNCVAFVEEVIEAGGGDWSSYSNCPVVATTDSVAERIQNVYNSMLNATKGMERGIYQLYGVPVY